MSLPEVTSDSCRAVATSPSLPSGARPPGRLLLTAAGLGLLALLPQPAAGFSDIPAPVPLAVPPAPPVPQQPAQSAAQQQPRPQVTGSALKPPKPPVKKVWSQGDLEALRTMPGAHVNFVDTTGLDEGGWAMTPASAGKRLDPAVAERLHDLQKEAETQIAALQRERLSASNPLLRGLNRDAAGNPVALRPVSEIDADINRWQGRIAAAREGLDTAARAAGVNPASLIPDAEE